MTMKKYLDDIKNFISKIPKKMRILICVGLVVVLGGAITAAAILNHTDYQSLFTGLNDTEAREIMAKLQDSGIEYQYKGNEILVDSKIVDRTKATLVNEGYPKSGFTYDVFTSNTNLMTTDYEKRTFKLYELQDRIASTISLFDGVKFATVTIALGEDQKYVLNSQDLTEASASVVVEMADGGSPTKEQVTAIQNLVSKSIPQMTIEHVGVFDGQGNDVTVKSDDDNSAATDERKLAYENNIENAVESNVLKVLLPFFGPKDVVVSVKSRVNMDKQITESIDYTAPLEDRESGIISNQQLLNEYTGGDQNATGVPGTDTNSDIPQYDTGTVDANGNYYSRSSDTNYLVNQKKQQDERNGVVLEDLTISVAVNATQLETLTREDLLAMVGNASGIAEELWSSKITIVNAPFYQAPQTESPIQQAVANGMTLSPMLIAALVGGGALFVLLLVLIITLLRRRKKRMDAEEEAMMMAPTPEELAFREKQEKAIYDMHRDMEEQELSPTEELVKQVRDFADENPDISAQLLKSWLKGGGSFED